MKNLRFTIYSFLLLAMNLSIALAGPRFVELELNDGRLVRGELVSEYDHSQWVLGDASDEVTYAIFDAAGFDENWRNDQSIRTFSSHDVRTISTKPAPKGWLPYQRFLRQQGIVLQGSGLQVPAYVMNDNTYDMHRAENGYGDHAWDFVVTDEEGNYFNGAGRRNRDHGIFGVDVFLPADGTIVEIERSAPDLKPGRLDKEAVNNFIGIRLKGGYYLYLLHFQQNTIPADLRVGQKVRAGTFIGRVGNSGVTLEPHLHTTLFWFDRKFGESGRYWSIPSEVSDNYVAANPGTAARQVRHLNPRQGTWISPEPFTAPRARPALPAKACGRGFAKLK